MNIILLSGGSGKRLWPLSNNKRPKQFIKIFQNEDGNFESMLQRTYHQILKADADVNITVTTGSEQVSDIINQLGDNVGISVEPCRRDTFPAIVLAVSFLVNVHRICPSESVVVCPVDTYAENDYYVALKELSVRANKGKDNLILMGIEPTYPSEKYGYIIPEKREGFSKVLKFKEKPNNVAAKEYIERGALWNGGVFACQLQYILDKAKDVIGYNDYQKLLDNYESLPQISFDYAVVEKETSIQVMRFSGNWKDVGTWDTLTEIMGKNVIGYGKLDEACTNVHIVNELDIPVLALGTCDMVIAASSEGILILDKRGSNDIKPYVNNLYD